MRCPLWPWAPPIPPPTVRPRAPPQCVHGHPHSASKGTHSPGMHIKEQRDVQVPYYLQLLPPLLSVQRGASGYRMSHQTLENQTLSHQTLAAPVARSSTRPSTLPLRTTPLPTPTHHHQDEATTMDRTSTFVCACVFAWRSFWPP